MAITYTNIENGESALSVRNKINNLGSAVVTMSQTVTQLIFFAPTEQQSGNYCVGSESNGNTIAIWCKVIPTDAITIPEILLIGKSTMTVNNGLTTAF